jgi:hypothetical protein
MHLSKLNFYNDPYQLLIALIKVLIKDMCFANKFFTYLK